MRTSVGIDREKLQELIFYLLKRIISLKQFYKMIKNASYQYNDLSQDIHKRVLTSEDEIEFKDKSEREKYEFILEVTGFCLEKLSYN